MRKRFRLQDRHSYSWWFALTIAIVVIGYSLLWYSGYDLAGDLLVAGVAVLAAFFYFLFGQHNFDAEYFRTLFKEFNERFDRLNDDLNRICSAPESDDLAPRDLQKLYDYFNLCAEEYLYFKAGYVDAEVWEAWRNGMAHFAATPKIRRVWAEELKQGSYYGFTLELLHAAA